MKNPKVAITHLVVEIDTQVTHHVVAMDKRRVPVNGHCVS